MFCKYVGIIGMVELLLRKPFCISAMAKDTILATSILLVDWLCFCKNCSTMIFPLVVYFVFVIGFVVVNDRFCSR